MVFTEDIDVRIEPPEGMDVKTGKNHTKPAHIKSRADFLSLADEDDQDRRYRVGRTRYFGQWFIMVTSWRRKAGFVTDGAIAIRETARLIKHGPGGSPWVLFLKYTATVTVTLRRAHTSSSFAKMVRKYTAFFPRIDYRVQNHPRSAGCAKYTGRGLSHHYLPALTAK
jgi:hypothetical protein